MTDRPTPSVFDQELLGRCISCGFCLPACPTYALTGDETASPRGRITLMRALESGTLPPDDPTLREQASFCLGCRACEPVCPAGVQYGTLLEQWRVRQWRGRRRPLLVRLLTLFAVRRWALRPLGLIRRAAGGGPHGADRPSDSPPGGARPSADRPSVRPPTDAEGREYLMLGCFERVLFPRVSRAAHRLLPHLWAPRGQGCCGALHAHNGDLAGGRRLARQLGEQLPGRIVTTSGGCAAHLAEVLGRDRVRELSAYLVEHVPGQAHPSARGHDRYGQVEVPDGHGGTRRARVSLQDSCHLRNGLDVWREPRDLLRHVADYVELPDAAACCGAAGSYSLLRPRDSARVLAPKLDQIEAAGVDFLIVVNPGCQRQLATGLRRRRSPVRVLHLAELLDRAGPPPGGPAKAAPGEGRPAEDTPGSH